MAHALALMGWLSTIPEVWTWVVAVVTVVGAVAAFIHAVLYKRDSRAAVIWVGFILMAPVAGAVFYFLFGINRIQRRASSLRGSVPPLGRHPEEGDGIDEVSHSLQATTLSRLVGTVTGLPLIPGNYFEPLIGGDEAFPAMFEAIESARQSVTLATYIFDRDSVGLKFVEVLRRAVKRGVEVRVLVDAAGARYSFPTIVGNLEKAGVRVARFLPTMRNITINLRNHRKILVVDGTTGFTGGMNIRESNCDLPGKGLRIMDTHFRVTGPIVANMQAVFIDDWLFSTGERLAGHPWLVRLPEVGATFARSIVDGPDGDMNKLKWTLLAGLSAAQESIQIVTPYFLPDQDLVAGLNLAAMRGVRVDIILPKHNNLKVVHWATMAILWQVLVHGCRVWFVPGVFDHSKMMIVDRMWSLIGSANWDRRSLRLNFEYNIECYGSECASKLGGMVDERIKTAREITLEDVDRRSLPEKIRDGIARLFIPLL